MAIWTRPSPRRGDATAGAAVGFDCNGDWIAPDAPVAAWLMEDLQMLGDIFSALSGSDRWRARCERVTSRVCPRFHQDAPPLRLITTYDGPGTEWAFDVELDGDLSARRAATRRHVRPTSAGSVLLLKGRAARLFEAGPALLHRSPAASRKHPRTVCTLDLPRPREAAGEADDRTDLQAA